MVVEVLWKVCSVLVNCIPKSSVVLLDTIHGFKEGGREGMATLEPKLAYQLDGLVHDPLSQVFLNVHKAYVSLGRER